MPGPKHQLTPKMKEKQWKKGQTGNPKGRPPISPIQRALKNLTIETYREVIQLVLSGNLTELKEMIEHPETPAIQVGVATAFFKAIKTGDYSVIERIAERIVGKIPDVIDIRSVNNSNTNLTISAFDRDKLKVELAKLESDV